MPFVLQNTTNEEVATATLINIYNIPYWGVKVWEDASAAEQEKEAFLEQLEVLPSEQTAWQLREVDESKVKMMNVKLNNQSTRRIHMDAQGVLRVVKL